MLIFLTLKYLIVFFHRFFCEGAVLINLDNTVPKTKAWFKELKKHKRVKYIELIARRDYASFNASIYWFC